MMLSLLGGTVMAMAQDKPPAAGAPKPATDKVKAAALASKATSVLVFVRAGQSQSAQAVKNTALALEGLPPVATTLVFSGKQDAEELTALTKGLSWPSVTDADYTLFGKHGVRVWPTTVIVLPDGKELARLTGMTQTHVRDLNAYLAFAAGKITRDALDKILATSKVIMDSPHQMARRHLLVAQRLLDKGQIKPAQQELAAGLKLVPDDPRLLLAKARILLLLNGPTEAMAILARLDEKSALAGRIGLLKGWALVSTGKWDHAIRVLQVAVKLNPDPSEAHYFLGVAYQKKGLLAEAAKSFRAGFEATEPGRRIAVPATKPPATQPAKPPAPAKTAPGKAS